MLSYRQGDTRLVNQCDGRFGKAKITLLWKYVPNPHLELTSCCQDFNAEIIPPRTDSGVGQEVPMSE